MSAPLKTFHVRLITHGYLAGFVEAQCPEDAEERTYAIWRTECPHPFEKDEDDELVSVIAEEVQP